MIALKIKTKQGINPAPPPLVDYVIPFITNIWPRERVFRTSSMVSSWISLLDDTGNKFPEVLTATRKFLVPIQDESHSLYRFVRDIGDKTTITIEHPESVLELMDAITPNTLERPPYELPQILDLIQDTDARLTRDRRFL